MWGGSTPETGFDCSGYVWSKRCKDEKLRGTVKEVVNQISHSKKWKSDIPLTDEKGNPLLRKNGKPMFRASYSILQDELFNYMTEQGFKGFQRGEYGSTAEHLTSLQYQIKQDKERLEKLQQRIQKEQVKYEPARQKLSGRSSHSSGRFPGRSCWNRSRPTMPPASRRKSRKSRKTWKPSRKSWTT